MMKTYEYEERAFLGEDEFLRVKEKLDSISPSNKLDNKLSYFFVLPDVNVSIASSTEKVAVKYKSGQLGKGNGFEEHEFSVEPTSLEEALKLFSALLKIKPQVSEQFRINYVLKDNMEIALKYTETWGFHMEIEKVYSANDNADQDAMSRQAENEIATLAQELGVHLITDQEMEEFKRDSEAGNTKGHYSPDEFRAKYGSLFGF